MYNVYVYSESRCPKYVIIMRSAQYRHVRLWYAGSVVVGAVVTMVVVVVFCLGFYTGVCICISYMPKLLLKRIESGVCGFCVYENRYD